MNKPLIYVPLEEVRTAEPQLPGYEKEGPEPSLESMVRHYYRDNLPNETDAMIEKLVEAYFRLLAS